MYGIYANIGGRLMGSMLPYIYIAYMDPMGDGLFWLWKTTSNLKDTEQHGNTRPGKLTYQLANWKMAIEIVDLPIKNGGFP